MGKETSIAWTDHTFNPWRGCTKVSPGCTHCYAERMAARNPQVLGVWGPQGTRVLASEAMWKQPLAWNEGARKERKHRMVFCASIADVFEDWPGQMQDHLGQPLWRLADGYNPALDAPGWAIPHFQGGEGFLPYDLDYARRRLWHLIQNTPWLDWQLLTKRPENIRTMLPLDRLWPNVWLGTSVESMQYAWRLDALKECAHQVPVRFVSAEPLLGPLSLWHVLEGLQWVIVGGESGAEARDMALGWARSLIAQCKQHGVAVFMKQVGHKPVLASSPRRVPLHLEGDVVHGSTPQDWPEDLRVWEFPHP